MAREDCYNSVQPGRLEGGEAFGRPTGTRSGGRPSGKPPGKPMGGRPSEKPSGGRSPPSKTRGKPSKRGRVSKPKIVRRSFPNEPLPPVVNNLAVKAPTLGDYPTALKDFSLSCFNRADVLGFDAEKKERVKSQIKTLIQRARDEGKLGLNDWSKQNLPIFDPIVPLELVCNLPSKTSSKDQLKRTIEHLLQKNSYSGDSFDSESRKRLRSQRFQKELNAAPRSSGSRGSSLNDQMSAYSESNEPLIGTCEDIEKRYLRLTSQADPTKVRPLHVLEKSLEFVLNKYNSFENKEGKYSYVCDQLKSIRQDLTVQLIENDFTVKVYETHAKIAIQNNDLGEYNQCQTRLQRLYEKDNILGSNQSEFQAYRILYFLVIGNYAAICKLKLYELYREELGFKGLHMNESQAEKMGKKGIVKQQGRLMTLDIEKTRLYRTKMGNIFIDYALRFFESITASNYFGYYRNYAKIVKLNKSKTYGHTFDVFLKLSQSIIDKVRIKSFFIMSKAYRKITLAAIQKEMKFESQKEIVNFLMSKNLQKIVLTLKSKTQKEDILLIDFTPEVKQKIANVYFKIHGKVDIKGQV